MCAALHLFPPEARPEQQREHERKGKRESRYCSEEKYNLIARAQLERRAVEKAATNREATRFDP